MLLGSFISDPKLLSQNYPYYQGQLHGCATCVAAQEPVLGRTLDLA